ncbi:MAG: crossover junction endodeoxyribonuclease RuvC [Patescibacteria group bacterium]
MTTPLRILGVDPGFDRTGFGFIESRGSDATWLAHGCIQTDASDGFSDRLKVVRDELQKLLARHQPTCVAVEQLFFSNNAKTAIKVGMARGVILLAIADAGVPLVELTPNQVKQGIAGWGGADKKQVQGMVQRVLKLKDIPKPDDAADALAIAIVGAMLYKRETLL